MPKEKDVVEGEDKFKLDKLKLELAEFGPLCEPDDERAAAAVANAEAALVSTPVASGAAPPIVGVALPPQEIDDASRC